MSFLSTMFGGSEAKSTPRDLTSPEVASTRQPLASVLLGLLGQGGQTVQGRQRGPGDDVVTSVTGATDPLKGIPQAPRSALEVAALTAQEQAILGALGASEGANRRAALDAQIAGTSNPFAEQALDTGLRKISEQYEEVLGRTLPGQFARAGHRVQPGQSSPFDRAAAIEARGFANALSDYAGQFQFNQYNVDRALQQNAIQISQNEVETEIQKLQAQALPRLIQQLGIDRGLEEFRRRSDQLVALLAIMTGAQQPSLGTEQKESSARGGVADLIQIGAGGLSGAFPNTTGDTAGARAAAAG